MRESIYTIPLNDVFAPKCGCPVCRLEELLESRCTEYIMGAAMMEPDIRIQTNHYGFCQKHFSQLSSQKNRLSLALMLETHLDELMEQHMPHKFKKGEPSPDETCFVCKEIAAALDKMLGTAVKLFTTDEDFRQLLLGQDYFCYRHYIQLCRKAESSLNRKQAAGFIGPLTQKAKADAAALREDVHDFTMTFDYRSAGNANTEERLKTAVERAIRFLE